MFINHRLNRLNDNLESLQGVKSHPAEIGHKVDDFPPVIQFIKRDLPNVALVSLLRSALVANGRPCLEAVAIEGDGVFNTLKVTPGGWWVKCKEQMMREKPVAFSESQMEEIEACLDELVCNTGAQEILLADIAGQLIMAKGRLNEREVPATGVAALSAGGYAAMIEMARYFEIETEFRQITYKGEYHSIY